MKRPQMAYSGFLRDGDRKAAELKLGFLSRMLGIGQILLWRRRQVTRHMHEPKIFITVEGTPLDALRDDAEASARRAGFRLLLPRSAEDVGSQCWECDGFGGGGKPVTFVIRLLPSVPAPATAR
ncbi:hypothetical protein HYW67_04010 [Candidatus Parcubacteria bacterium]|nr:hypothetical protein [Candidatus Parcubacteria bacterium]